MTCLVEVLKYSNPQLAVDDDQLEVRRTPTACILASSGSYPAIYELLTHCKRLLFSRGLSQLCMRKLSNALPCT